MWKQQSKIFGKNEKARMKNSQSMQKTLNRITKMGSISPNLLIENQNMTPLNISF